MAIRTRKLLLVVLLIGALFYSPCPLFSSGPFFPRAVFTYATHPDLPLEKFVQGELGVLQPTYEGPALYVAYRYLIGTGFDAEEQEAVLNVWNTWLGLEPTLSGPGWLAAHWYAARTRVPEVSAPPPIEVYRSIQAGEYSFVSYPNCLNDAFLTAAETLTKRIEQFGADSAEVQDWVQAQDQVFANCAGGQTIPAAAAPGTHPLIQADRTYQIAAAHFYAGNFDIARKMFEDIAKDSSSPWRQMASYLVARTLLRKATVDAGPGKTDWATFAQAEVELQEVLKDSSRSEVHPAAQRLLNFVRSSLHPAERLQELAQALLQKHSGATLRQDLRDYLVLLRKGDRSHGIRSKDEVADWAYIFHGGQEGALEYAWQKWQETTSAAWLVALLSNGHVGHPQLPQLLEAAAQVTPASPAYLTVTFHHIRLLIESGKKEEARERLDALLSSGRLTSLPSALNLFLGQRMRLARDLDEFLKYAPRLPAGITIDLPEAKEMPSEPESSKAGRALLDTDSAQVLNGLPLNLLKQAATSPVLPVHLRQELALATWVRAVLLNNEKIGEALVPVLTNLMPDLKEDLTVYRSAKNQEAREFAAVFLLLKLPGARPYIGEGLSRQTPFDQVDSFRDNWWDCQGGGGATLGTVDFLDETQKAAARQELEKPRPSVDATFRLVIEWAKKHPNDPRVPEALHRAVKSARYGCTSGELSRQAFQLLHKRYPNSSWAKKTKYWYR